MTDPTTALTDALDSLYDAGAVRVPPWMAMVAALASARPGSIGESIDWLTRHRDSLERAYEGGRTAKLGLAHLPPEMQYEPELGALNRERNDHALRQRWIFGDLAGKSTFFQTAVYVMTGVELSREEGELLEEIGVINIQADRRAWPLAVTRRIAARGGGHSAALVAGSAMMGATVLAGEAAADCARFLHRVRAAEAEGQTPNDVVKDTLARGDRVMGFGRPLVGPDERVPVMLATLARFGRHELPFVTLLARVEAAFTEQKGLRTTSAAWAAAILSDFGLHPDAVQAVCHFWVSVTLHSQAVYAGERRVP